MKKTTGKHYAMKIQYKKNLLRQHSKNLANVDNEKVGPRDLKLDSCYVLAMYMFFWMMRVS